MKYSIAIPSLSRSPALAKHPLLRYATVVVQPHQLEEYQEACPAAKEILALPEKTRGPAQTRDWILRNVWNDDEEFCFQVDDDLIGVYYTMSRHARLEKDPAYMLEVVESVGAVAVDAGAGIFGFAHTARPHERSALAPFGLRSRIDGNAMGVIDRALKFDHHLMSKEDMDISLMAWATGNRFTWMDLRWCWLADAWSNKGGMVEVRTSEVEREALEYLRDKWGGGIVTLEQARERKTGLSVRLNVT